MGPLVQAAFGVGLFPRWNGKRDLHDKIPDLIRLKEREYIDHTATHRHRGP